MHFIQHTIHVAIGTVNNREIIIVVDKAEDYQL